MPLQTSHLCGVWDKLPQLRIPHFANAGQLYTRTVDVAGQSLAIRVLQIAIGDLKVMDSRVPGRMQRVDQRRTTAAINDGFLDGFGKQFQIPTIDAQVYVSTARVVPARHVHLGTMARTINP